MLESIFIFMAAIGFVLFILGIYEKSAIYSFMSLIVWLIVMANALYVQVPTDTTTYTEYGFSAFCMAFVFANIVWMLSLYMEFRKTKVI